MIKDFLGEELKVGSRVVALKYNRTSADLHKGTVTKLHDKMVTVKIDGLYERRFEPYKLIKIPMIEELEAKLKEERSRRYQAECNYDHWREQAERLTKERDALLEDIDFIGGCEFCSHYNGLDNECSMAGPCKFDWRGVQEGTNELLE